MADQETLCMLTAIIFVICAVCTGFNLDPRFSVIKKGSSDYYFGYSVTVHQSVKNDGSVDKNWLLVGAPKEKVLVGRKVRGGVIYQCDATTTAENDCTQVNDLLPADVSSDGIIEEDQWLGVVLYSHGKGKKIVTCAHRYIKSNAGLGICYTFTIPVQRFEVQQYIPCQKGPHNNYMEDFGLCQAGISAVIGHEALVMGAPGSVYWRGALFYMNISDALGVYRNYISSPCFQEGDPPVPPVPPTNLYSYLGYSVDLGKFDTSGNLYFVAGAPRSEEKGEVVFFINKGVQNDILPYGKKQILQGTKNFAGFGSSVLAVDLNDDRIDDLVVGAPYYFEKGRGGAIYIYYGGSQMINDESDKKTILSRKMSDAECVSLGCEHARFGLSLAKLGDVNIDGYQDIAVGAPYEGSGAVYIYHGSKTGIADMYAQRIIAKDMPGDPLSSFGYSLSGGMDLDDNGYPDLLVGSYESGTVSLLRSRPIIRLQPELEARPRKFDLSATPYCPVDDTEHHCAQLEICLAFTAKPEESFREEVDIDYVVEAERSLSIARLEMVGSVDPKKKTVTGSITLSDQGERGKKCVTHLAYLKEVFTDKLNPIEMTVTFSRKEKSFNRPPPGSPLPNINEYPILSTDGTAAGSDPNSVSAYVDFVKKCGPNDECSSNLQFEVKLDLPMEGNNYILRDGEFSQADLSLIVTNLGESAYLTQIYVLKPPRLTQQSVEGKGQDRDVTCRPVPGDDTLIRCEDIGNPLKQNSSVSIQLSLLNRIEATDEVLNVTVWVNTTSTETTPFNDKFVFPFKVIREADLVLRVYQQVHGGCHWTDVWCPPEGELTHTSSTSKKLLSSVGGLVGGVLGMVDQNRRH